MAQYRRRTAALMISTSVVCVLSMSVPVLAQDTDNQQKPTILLDAVIVSAGEPKVAINTPQSVSVLDQEAIDAAQASTVGELIQTIPGVSMRGGASALGQGFNIRGVGTSLGDPSSDIIVQVDGVSKFFEAYRLGTTFAEPELYKRVEVLKGPASATLIGNGAIGGVVSFTTKDADDFLSDGDGFALRVKGGYESNSDSVLGSGIAAGKVTDDFGLLLAVTARDAQDYENGDGDIVAPSDVKSNSYLLKGTYNIGGAKDHVIRASVQRWKSNSAQLYDQQAAAFDSTVRRDVTDDTFIIAYENGFSGSKMWDVEAQFSYAASTVEQSDNTFAPGSLGVSSEYSYDSLQARLQNTSEFSMSELWTTYLTYGIQFESQERRNPRLLEDGTTQLGTTSHPEGDTSKTGAFVQAEILYSDKLTIIPGIRFDRSKYEPGDAAPVTDTSTVNGFSPKIAALYNITDSFGVFASYAHTIRLPVLDEVFSYSRGDTNVNLNLDPEESDNFEIGATLSFNDTLVSGDALRSKVTYFHNDVSNQISRGGAGSPSFINIGEAKYTGIEVEAEYAVDRFFSRFAYSAINGKNTITDAFLNTIPADELDITLGYSFVEQRLSVAATAEVAAHQNEVSNGGNTDGYEIFGLSATWKPDFQPFKGLEFRAAINNITDEQFRRHLSNLDAEGRTVKLSVAAVF